MFACAIYDVRRRTLLLVRDRFGIKPQFYAVTGASVAFASELRPLLHLPGVNTATNRQAVHDFTALGYIPAPATFYQGIQTLEPGCWLEAAQDTDGAVSITRRRFHAWRVSVDPTRRVDDLVDRAESLVRGAVARQLESDVPLGSLLSGGIDSSLVSTAAQAAARGGLRTFNVRFAETAYDETWAAEAVAAHIGSRHTALDLSTTPGSWDDVTSLLLHTGQPFADTSLFGVNAVCRAMRRHVAVALSGDGGDEGFGGYDTFWQIERILRFQHLSQTTWAPVSGLLGPLEALGVVSRRLAHRVQEVRAADDTQLLQSLLCWVGPDEHRMLCQPDADMLPVRRWFEPQWEYELPRSATHLERLSAYVTEMYTRLTLANDFLFKVDIASMRESLEVRVPMLDEDLFEFGLSLPHSRKVRRRACKTVLRAVAARWLPATVARKAKRGFAVPVDTWVTDEFKHTCREVLLDGSSPLADLLRPEAYRPLVGAFCDGTPYSGISRPGLYQRAIMLLSLHLHLVRRSTVSIPDTTVPVSVEAAH
jgi:asparagine synthase (glutamine-hydrolysing)